jgi:hypothetical protein
MTNIPDHTDDDPRTDELLNRLIRAAAQRTPSEFAWPQDEIILACILGKATEAQRDEVQAAAAQSSEFRRFLVDTAAQLSDVTSDSATEAFDAVGVPASVSGKDDSRNGTQVSPLPKWLRTLFRPRVLAPVLAGAAVIVMMLSFDRNHQLSPDTRMFAEHSQLNLSLFVSTSARSGQNTDSIPRSAATSFEAAVERLRESVAYDLGTGTYKLTDGPPLTGSPDASRTIVLRLTDKHGDEIGKIAAHQYRKGDTGAEAWIMIPPAMTLWHLTMPADSIDVPWWSELPARGCATFTEHTDSGYVASPGKIFQL